MNATMRQWVEPVALAIEVAGAAVIVVGGIIATVLFFLALARQRPFEDTYHAYRANLGRAILLGLEILIAGDIIATILIETTLASVAALGLIVLIRTFLSFSLETEIEGQFPWHRARTRGT